MASDNERPRRRRKYSRPASTVRSTTIKWAWTGRVPLGYLTALSGREGVGKGVLTAYACARWTHGELEGHLFGHPCNVMLVTSEDGPDDTWKPRLEVAGADLNRVFFFTPPESWTIDKPDRLWTEMTAVKATILVIEAVFEHLPAARGGAENSPRYVRETLRPVRTMLREEKWAGVYTMHPPKSINADPRSVFQSSQAWTAVPRTTLYVDYHPADVEKPEELRRRVMIRGKGNISRVPSSVEFDIGAKEYTADDGGKSQREYVDELKDSEVTPAQLLSPKAPKPPTKVEQAIEIMERELPLEVAKPANLVIPLLEEFECASKATINEARKRLNVQTNKTEGGWEWIRKARV